MSGRLADRPPPPRVSRPPPARAAGPIRAVCLLPPRPAPPAAERRHRHRDARAEVASRSGGRGGGSGRGRCVRGRCRAGGASAGGRRRGEAAGAGSPGAAGGGGGRLSSERPRGRQPGGSLSAGRAERQAPLCPEPLGVGRPAAGAGRWAPGAAPGARRCRGWGRGGAPLLPRCWGRRSRCDPRPLRCQQTGVTGCGWEAAPLGSQLPCCLQLLWNLCVGPRWDLSGRDESERSECLACCRSVAASPRSVLAAVLGYQSARGSVPRGFPSWPAGVSLWM